MIVMWLTDLVHPGCYWSSPSQSPQPKLVNIDDCIGRKGREEGKGGRGGGRGRRNSGREVWREEGREWREAERDVEGKIEGVREREQTQVVQLYELTSSLRTAKLWLVLCVFGPVTNSSPKMVNERLSTGDHTHPRMLAVTKPQSLQKHNKERWKIPHSHSLHGNAIWKFQYQNPLPLFGSIRIESLNDYVLVPERV